MFTLCGAFWSLGSRGLAVRGWSSLQCLAGVYPFPLTLSSRQGHASRGHVPDARGALRYRKAGSGVRRLRFAGAAGLALLGGGC